MMDEDLDSQPVVSPSGIFVYFVDSVQDCMGNNSRCDILILREETVFTF